MKRTLSLIIIVCWVFAACQPTPEKPVVQNKGDGELEKAIMQTAVLETEEPQNIIEPHKEIRIKDTRTNDAGTITVNIDAEVIAEGNDNITVARLGKYYYKQEEIEKMIHIIFGDNLTFYDPTITTKSEIEYNILYLQKRLLDDEVLLEMGKAKGLTDLQEIKEKQLEIIEDLKKQVASAPEEKPIINKINIEEGFAVSVDFGEDVMGGCGCIEPNSSRAQVSFNMFCDNVKSARCLHYLTTTPIKISDDDHEVVESLNIAQNLINRMEIIGVRVDDVFISKDNAWGVDEEGRDAVVSEREFYVFCFGRVVGDRVLDFTFYDGTEQGEEYDKPVPYEKIEVWVEDNKVVKFNWIAPAIVTEIINDNVELQIGYEQALDLAVNYIFISNAGSLGDIAESIIGEITNIEFEMVRIREKNSEDYLIVPAWKIYGELKMKLTDEHKNKHNITEDFYSFTTSWYGKNFVTINALDGSIIDMGKGY